MYRHVRFATESDIDAVAGVVHLALESHLARGGWSQSFPQLDHSERQAIIKEIVTISSNEDGEDVLRTPEGVTPYLSFRGFLLAETEDGKIAGGLKPYDSSKENFLDLFGLAATKVLVKMYGEEKGMQYLHGFGKVMGSFLCIFGRLKEDKEPKFHVETVGTFPGFERQGACQKLMARAFEIGREWGFDTAHIMLLADNWRAENAYQKAGFKLDLEIHSPAMKQSLGITGVKFMSRVL